MKIKKKTMVSMTLVLTVSLCALAGSSRPGKGIYRNLRVLPKNISSKDLQEIMVDDFQDGLGVTCNFCHETAQKGHGLDFESDAKPEKEISRAMMRMTLGINKKYFKQQHARIGSDGLAVTCATCHRGEPFPGGNAEKK